MSETALLRQFIDMCKKNSDILHKPEFQFYKEYLESLGAVIPPAQNETAKESAGNGQNSDSAAPMDSSEKPDDQLNDESEEEPDQPLQLDDIDVIEPDTTDEPLAMGDDTKETTEADIEAAEEKRDCALASFREGEYEQAVKSFTEAIELHPGSALLHAKRANALLKLSKPMAAIRDCDKAISINPDAAQAYKFRGRAHQLLGHWVEAHRDLATACKLDYDDTANEWLKEVEGNAKKIAEYNRTKERRKEEKEQKRARRVREEQREAREKMRQEQNEEMPAGGMPPGMEEVFSDPELMTLFQDKEVINAYMEIMQNPASITKYMNNAKVMKLVEKLQKVKTGQSKKGPVSPEEFFKEEADQKETEEPPAAPPKAPEPDLD